MVEPEVEPEAEAEQPLAVTSETREEKVSIFFDLMMMMMMKAMMTSVDDDDQCSDIPQLDQPLWVRPLCERPLRRSLRWTHHFAGVYIFSIICSCLLLILKQAKVEIKSLSCSLKSLHHNYGHDDDDVDNHDADYD